MKSSWQLERTLSDIETRKKVAQDRGCCVLFEGDVLCDVLCLMFYDRISLYDVTVEIRMTDRHRQMVQ